MFHAEEGRWIDRYNEADGRFSEFCESALEQFHIKILGNARVVTVYSTGECCIIWKRYLLINIADVSTRIYRMLQYAELFTRFVACYAIWRHFTHTQQTVWFKNT